MSTVVRGLDAICRSREEQNPTVKQLDFVRDVIGEEELDRVLMLNLNRGQVTKIIKDWDASQKRPNRYWDYVNGDYRQFRLEHAGDDRKGD